MEEETHDEQSMHVPSESITGEGKLAYAITTEERENLREELSLLSMEIKATQVANEARLHYIANL